MGDDNFDFLEYLRHPIINFSLEDDSGCDPWYKTTPLFDTYEDEFLASFEGLINHPFDVSGSMCLLESSSMERESAHCLEISSSSTLCDIIVESTHGDDFLTSSEFRHEDTLVEVDLCYTSLYSLFPFDDMYAIVKSTSLILGKAYGGKINV